MMKKTLLAATLSSVLLIPAFVNASEYKIDSKGAHASINFRVSHLGYSFIQGRFNKFDGFSKKVNTTIFNETISNTTLYISRDSSVINGAFYITCQVI